MDNQQVKDSLSILEIAKKTHDDFVREAEEKAKAVMEQAVENAQKLLSEAREERDKVILAASEEEAHLRAQINNLRLMESEYKNRLGLLIADFLKMYESYTGKSLEDSVLAEESSYETLQEELTPDLELAQNQAEEYESTHYESERENVYEAEAGLVEDKPTEESGSEHWGVNESETLAVDDSDNDFSKLDDVSGLVEGEETKQLLENNHEVGDLAYRNENGLTQNAEMAEKALVEEEELFNSFVQENRP